MRVGVAMRVGIVLTLALAVAPPRAAAETRTVALVVTDAEGVFVSDIRPNELQILENGQPREIVSFQRDDRPLTVALVLDASDEGLRVFRVHAVGVIEAFLARLPPRARCTLWTTGGRARKAGDLAGDEAAIEKAIAGAFGAGGTNALLDTLVEASASLGAESGRRRALVAVSGRAAGHTSWAPGDVTARVRRAGGRVLGVMYREGATGSTGSLMGLDAPRDTVNLTIVGPDAHERILSGLAQGTGGRFASVGIALGVGRVLEAYAAELGGQYRVRFGVGDTKGPKRIDARVTRPGAHWRVTVDTP